MSKREERKKAYREELARDSEVRGGKAAFRLLLKSIAQVICYTENIDDLDWQWLVHNARKAEIVDNETARIIAVTTCLWMPLEWKGSNTSLKEYEKSVNKYV